MGVIDGTKASTSAKSKDVTVSGTNGHTESAIPQMVLTSVEGESEELKLENDEDLAQRKNGEGAVTVLPATSDVTPQISTHADEITVIREILPQITIIGKPPDVKAADQRPLVISSETSKVEHIGSRPESIYEPVELKTSFPAQQNGLSDEDGVGTTDTVNDSKKTPKGGESFFAKGKAFFKHEKPIFKHEKPAFKHEKPVFEHEKSVLKHEKSVLKHEKPFFKHDKPFFKHEKPIFSLPKFSFGGKEPKDAKKEQKTITQEYSVEAAEATQESSGVVGVYKKRDEDDATITEPKTEPAIIQVEKQVTFKPTERSSMIHPPTSASSSLPPIHRAEEDDFNLAEETSMRHKPLMVGIRGGSPESLHDTCCLRLAVLLRNKALEIASDSKVLPPKKPPKPTTEALAKARSEITTKRLREYENRPHNFGDDIPVGFHGIRYADEDTESSNDYKDLENYGVVANPECYGIIRKMKDENDDSLRASSTCSYYTADTATLKDENSSDNTLETVSLGSYDSIVCRPEQKDDIFDGSMDATSSLPSTLVKDKKSTAKKVPPPVPPKPATPSTTNQSPSVISSSSPTSTATASEVAKCVNSLSLSPRPVLRTVANTDSIKKRPLSIAGVKATEFENLMESEKSKSLTKKPVLKTVVKNNSLKAMRNLPVETPKGITKSLSFTSKSKASETAKQTPPKPPPPPRPPPPVAASSPKKNEVPTTSPKPKVPATSPEPKLPATSPEPKLPVIKLDRVISPKPKEPTKLVEKAAPPARKVQVRPIVSPPRPPPAPKPIPKFSKSPVRPPRPPPPCKPVSPDSGKEAVASVLEEAESNKNLHLDLKPKELPADVIKDVDWSDKNFVEVPLSESPMKIVVDEGVKVEEPAGDKLEVHAELTPEALHHDELNKMSATPEGTIRAPARRSKPPRPPPRVRRDRSRTVEIAKPSEKVVEVRRRSQSLSDIEIDQRSTPITSLSPRDAEMKVIYTTVNKDRTKIPLPSFDTELDRLSTSSEMSSRPLPPPPPPPRSKSHSASRRSKSDERPSTASSMFEDDCSLCKSESLPSEINGGSLRPPRRKKTDKEQFLSLGRLDRSRQYSKPKVVFSSLKNVREMTEIPVKPERRIKHPQQPEFDENANISNPIASKFYVVSENLPPVETMPPPLPSRTRVHSLGPERVPSDLSMKSADTPLLQRSKSESTKAHSSWYDEEVTSSVDDSWEKVDYPIEEDADSVSPNIKRPPRTKPARQTSKFYVEVKDEEARPYANIPTQLSREDKETSPLPLACSEKSVQTSLETLSHGRRSRGELSEDTDDLLDLAQTLQDELKTIIKRHKKEDLLKYSDDSSEHGASEPRDSKGTAEAMTFKQRPPLESTTSSASELWQISSSDESDDACADEQTANLSEVSRIKKKKKVFYIAQEITSSEEAFVDALKLLNVDFRAYIDGINKQKGSPIVPDEVLSQIFNHLPQLQHLNENLLMELKFRIEQWDSVNKLADVIVKMGPFLKLYSWYIQDFESATSLLEEAKRKYFQFAQAVKEYELSPRCKRLTLNHYMLKPVQRIPQYRLLLQEYLHHLAEGSEDYEDTVEALKIVSEVANHANESMRHGDNFQKLMSIQSSIIGHKEIIKPGRRFIKEGELMKLSRKGMQPRWFVLLNDLLLYLTPVQQGLYRINHELTLAGMKVAIPLQQDYQNEFSIISVTRSFTLNAKSHEERQDWILALAEAIEENASKRSTFTAVRLQKRSEQASTDVSEQGFILGKTAPVWIPDARVTMCQLCTSEFTVTFRRHHCRACGKVVCSICSSNRISLPYLGNRIARVCDECYPKLGQGSSGCTESGETDSDNQQIAVKSHLRTDRHKKGKRQLPSVLKEVCANDVGSTISGYIHKRSNNSWKKSWFVIKEKVLYEFRASEDVAALKSLPLLGFQINTFSEPFEGVEPILLFEISHLGQAPILFHTETQSAAERWIKELKEATVLE